MKVIGEEVVSQGVVSLSMGMKRHYKRMRMCIRTTSETLPPVTAKLTRAQVYVKYIDLAPSLRTPIEFTYTGAKLTWSRQPVDCGLRSKR